MKNLFFKPIALFTLFSTFGCGGEYNVKKPFCKQSFELALVTGKTAVYQGEKSSGCSQIIGNQEIKTEHLLYRKNVAAKDEMDLGITSVEVLDADPENLQVRVTYANPEPQKEGEVVNRTGSDLLTEADTVEELAPDTISVLVIRK